MTTTVPAHQKLFSRQTWPWIMVAVLLLAWAINTYQLGAESIWTDEGLTFTFAVGPTTNILPLYSQLDDYHPPLQYLAWHYWLEIVGRSEFALRTLGALAGLVTLALVYQTGRSLFARSQGAAVGIATSLLVATSGFHVYYAQNIRAYCLMELLGVASCLACYQLTRHFSFRNLMAYALVSTALLYTHLYSFFVLLGQNIFIALWLYRVWRRNGLTAIRRSLGNWIFLQLTLAAAFLLWLPVLLYQLQHFKTMVAAQPALGLIIGTFLEFTWSAPAFIVIVCLLILSGYIAIRRKLAPQPSLTRPISVPANSLALAFLGTGLVSLYLIPLIISLATRPFFLARYAIPVLPAFYMLIVWVGLSQLRRLVSITLLSAIFFFQLLGLQNLFAAPNNEDWRAATAYMDQTAQPSETVFFFPGLSQGAFDYYSTRPDLVEISLPPGDGLSGIAAQLNAQPQPATLWLALAYVNPADFDGVLRQHGYAPTQQRAFFRLNLIEYHKVGP